MHKYNSLTTENSYRIFWLIKYIKAGPAVFLRYKKRGKMTKRTLLRTSMPNGSLGRYRVQGNQPGRGPQFIFNLKELI